MRTLRTLVFAGLALAAGLDASAQRVGLCPAGLERAADGLGSTGAARVMAPGSWSGLHVDTRADGDGQPSDCLFGDDGQVLAALYPQGVGASQPYVRVFGRGRDRVDVPVAGRWARWFSDLDEATRARIATVAGLAGAPGAPPNVARGDDLASLDFDALRAASFNPARPAPQNVTAGLRVTERTYDALDQLISETVQLEDGSHATIAYTYYHNGQRRSVTDAFGRVTLYEYDARARLSRVTVNQGLADEHVTTYEYWPDSLLKTIVAPDDTTTSYDYDRADRLTSVLVRRGATVVTSYAYSYDANSNRTRQVEINGGAPETTTYAYDELDRMTRVTYDDGRSAAYAYDNVGNRTRETERSAAGAVTSDKIAAFDQVNRLMSVTDAVNPANNATFAYDRNGNLRTKSTATGTTTLAYDARNLLVETRNGELISARFAYDAFGRRYLKIGNDGVRQYLYDQTSLLHELSERNVEVAKYEWGGDRLVSLWRHDEPRSFFHFDALGSATALTNATGDVVARYHYDAWGNHHDPAELQASANRIGFTGYYFDSETNLYFAKSRYFDAQFGRFLTQDSNQGELADPPSLNRYLYANANPTRFTDPTGRFSWESFKEGLRALPRAIAEPAFWIYDTTLALGARAFDIPTEHLELKSALAQRQLERVEEGQGAGQAALKGAVETTAASVTLGASAFVQAQAEAYQDFARGRLTIDDYDRRLSQIAGGATGAAVLGTGLSRATGRTWTGEPGAAPDAPPVNLTAQAEALAELAADAPNGAFGADTSASTALVAWAGRTGTNTPTVTGVPEAEASTWGTSTRPSWLDAADRGAAFNKARQFDYPARELYLDRPGGGYVRLDAYDPIAGEIISRKLTQLGQVRESTAIGYLRELAAKYPPGARIARVPSSGPLAGKAILGQQILEVPIQMQPIPRAVLKEARRLNVIIRDVGGNVY